MKKILLVSNRGGHLAQSLLLAEAFPAYEKVWVSERVPDVLERLVGKRVYYGHSPTERHYGNLLRNLIFAIRVLRLERPDLVLSTGAGLFVPFLLLSRLFGARVIFVEVYDRFDSLTRTGRLARLFADRIFVQWEGLAEKKPGIRYIGELL